MHILDFFVLELWDSLPRDWIAWFSSVDNVIVREDLIHGLDRELFLVCVLSEHNLMPGFRCRTGQT
jgi:hypothetical protein